MNVYKVRFGKQVLRRIKSGPRLLVFAKTIDDAKLEARKLRPDCEHLDILEVNKIGGCLTNTSRC